MKKKRPMRARRGVVGRYALGDMMVQLRLQNSWRGGSFHKLSVPSEIAVGCKEEPWPMVVAILTHEVMEFALDRLDARCVPSPDYARASDGYLFHYDHRIHGEACAQAGLFLAAALPALATAYKRLAKARKT